MPKMGSYDYMGPISLPVDMDKLAEIVESAVYGTHRFLSALVRVRRQKNPNQGEDRLAQEIERLLNEGYW